MFAILLSKEMDPFYSIIFSFPTIIYTFLVLLMTLFWSIAVLGLREIEIFDFDIDADSSSSSGVLTGLMLKLGLFGVPFTIILSFLALYGLVICYFMVKFSNTLLPSEALQSAVGLVIFPVSLYFSAKLSAASIKPMRKLFARPPQNISKHIIGQTAIVRSSVVNQNMGEAVLADGGAGLILKVRCQQDQSFKKGDEVVLLQYEANSQIYHVISTTDFLGK